MRNSLTTYSILALVGLLIIAGVLVVLNRFGNAPANASPPGSGSATGSSVSGGANSPPVAGVGSPFLQIGNSTGSFGGQPNGNFGQREPGEFGGYHDFHEHDGRGFWGQIGSNSTSTTTNSTSTYTPYVQYSN